ncbi:hypothetical protein [Mangrovicoccus algicola]|uniref:Uncharacterized protein n=1 Tax=Mangrovicoccus algicola TaxID=2771008 RepID=A0A8J7CUG9_9RHOB|nr:hypothetical protein [Mangrovicoccus algicola]MBE3637484.1 hypothetical protein [Mangrovicoccus algicola]
MGTFPPIGLRGRKWHIDTRAEFTCPDFEGATLALVIELHSPEEVAAVETALTAHEDAQSSMIAREACA